jgi:uncharacterized CHY-type Zn-finger protein
MKKILVLLFLLSLLFIGCVQELQKAEKGEKVEMPTPGVTPSETPKPTPKPTVTPVRPKYVEATGAICENCHINEKRQYVPQAKTIAGHVDGSQYCFYCHAENKSGNLVEEIAKLHHSKYTDCNLCHKSFTLTELDCGNCHAADDPFKPSEANLLDIHIPRGVDCQSCHGDDFLRIHEKREIFPEEFPIPR